MTTLIHKASSDKWYWGTALFNHFIFFHGSPVTVQIIIPVLVEFFVHISFWRLGSQCVLYMVGVNWGFFIYFVLHDSFVFNIKDVCFVNMNKDLNANDCWVFKELYKRYGILATEKTHQNQILIIPIWIACSFSDIFWNSAPIVGICRRYITNKNPFLLTRISL